VLDSKLLRSDPAAVAANLQRRGFSLDVAAFTALEERRKAAQIESDKVRAERNANAKAVGMAKGKGEDASALLKRAEELTSQLAASDASNAAVQTELDAWQLGLPNMLARVRAGWARRDGQQGRSAAGVRHGNSISSHRITSRSARSSAGSTSKPRQRFPARDFR
jgi:seryl-tRNA synthetase